MEKQSICFLTQFRYRAGYLVMKPLHGFCILILFLVNIKGFDAFSQQAVFTQVPQPDAGSAWTGTQDQNGYMWFGGTGVHRYDGYSYKSYFNDPRNPSSLAKNRIETIYADSKGFIWVGTNGKGLDRLDPETGIFTHFPNIPADSNSISNDFITSIIEDDYGKIWVGTEFKGLNCLDPKTGVITRFRHDPNDSNSLSFDKITALYKDLHGTIWVGTGFLWNAPLNERKRGGLNRFNRANNNFTRFMHNPNDTTSIIDNRIRSIFEDSKGRFWVGTSGDGLHTMNREKGSFHRYRYDAADPNALSRPAIQKSTPLADDMITFIREDAGGIVWIGTLLGGLKWYDPEAGKMHNYPVQKESPTNVKDIPYFIWCDISKDGVVWVASWTEGIFRLDPYRRQIPKYDIGRIVRSLHQDGNNNLWIGTDHGLVVYDEDRITNKSADLGIPDTLSSSNYTVYSIVEDGIGGIWVGADNGLSSYDPTSKKITQYEIKNPVHCIYTDRQGLFWLGTGKGLVLMKKDSSFTNVWQNSGDSTGVENGIRYIREDSTGYLWIGLSEEGGIVKLDKKTNQFQRFLQGYSIKSLFKDTENRLWVGTNVGLFYYDPVKDSVILYTNISAGFQGNIYVYNILEDDQQFLWINTSTGIFRFSHDRHEIIYYGKKENSDIPIYFTTQADCFIGKGGELFFSNYNGKGYYAFMPTLLVGNKTKPELHITGFRLGDQLVYPGEGSPLKLPVSQTKVINLTHNQKNFSFDFAGIHFSNPSGNRHQYMLENLDNDWRTAGEEKTAYYYNVPPGNYVFRVKAASSDGVWTEEKSVVVIISPPWWRTWWAYSFYGFCFLTGLFLVDRIQRRRIIEKQRMQSREKELAQAREIEQAYHTLKATQSQLIQSEKMASLGELTAGIAHEIQNPLNFVNNFAEINKELISEMKAEMDRGNIGEAKTIATGIEENSEKITDHGKRADAIVKSMLQHSRISTGQKELTDINALADEYLRLSYHGLRAKDKSFNATLHTDFDNRINKVNIIPQEIGRVLLNLYNNAFYAVAEKSKLQPNGYLPMVNVSTKLANTTEGNQKGSSQSAIRNSQLSPRSESVIISVKDNGNGIPQKVIGKIFQPFFTTKPTGQGTGLGLSLSYDIIKSHGGELKVETKEGEGTEFIIQLPIV